MQVVLFDGSGGEWLANLENRHGQWLAQLNEFNPQTRCASLSVTLVQALPAADKMDGIIQKCVQLGVQHIVPVSCQRSIVRLSGERLHKRWLHWQKVIVAACEQSGSNILPKITQLHDLRSFLAEKHPDVESPFVSRILLATEAKLRLRELPSPVGQLVLLVGPEGGFNKQEQQAIRLAGFVEVSLGSRVLRCETAGMAALAACLALWSDS